MRLTLLCVGRLKEKYLKDAVDEYGKRLQRYARTEVLEVQDEKTEENASEAENQRVLKAEGGRILEKLPKGAYVIALGDES